MKYTLNRLKKADWMLALATLEAIQENPTNINYVELSEQYIKHLMLRSAISYMEINKKLDDERIKMLDDIFKEKSFKILKPIFED